MRRTLFYFMTCVRARELAFVEMIENREGALESIESLLNLANLAELDAAVAIA